MKEKNIDKTDFKYTANLILKQLFEFRKGPTPWTKAFFAGLCASLPLLAGILMGDFGLGLLGGIGGFTYLYVFNETYAVRAKKIFMVALTISFLVGLGTIAAQYTWLVILILGIIGFTATFIFGVFRIPGPAAIFFVLSFTITTSMPADPSQAPLRFLVVFASGMLAWALSMIGWFKAPYKAEIKAVEDMYESLASFSEAKNLDGINSRRHSVVEYLRTGKEIFSSGPLLNKDKGMYDRLAILNQYADELFLELLESYFNKGAGIPESFSKRIREIKFRIRSIEVNGEGRIGIEPAGDFSQGYEKLSECIKEIEEFIDTPLENIDREIILTSKTSGRLKIMSAFDKNFIVFANSLRYGLVLSLSALIAFTLPFTRPYWVPLSCAAVMFGSTIMTTFNRAFLRSVGTIIGTLIATLILSFEPAGLAIAAINMLLTMITELVVVRNYALVAVFITPNALMLADAVTKDVSTSQFAEARILAIVVGSLIGLSGTFIIGRKSASGRLPVLVSNLIKTNIELFENLKSSGRGHDLKSILHLKERMEIDLENLRLAYSTALGEIPVKKESLEMMWPVISSLSHICFLLGKLVERRDFMEVQDKDLISITEALEEITKSIEADELLADMKLLDITEMPKLSREMNHLQEMMSMIKIKAVI
ncbi:FUSC family protein [Proteocatella sphenisci]|uniref:FUSC family protein n=1 Tax=Proteocatella sphenisci TaxID=181070 RepID=UPI0004BA2816|nr:FUSC family protein [Proteocatella sphenisci]